MTRVNRFAPGSILILVCLGAGAALPADAAPAPGPVIADDDRRVQAARSDGAAQDEGPDATPDRAEPDFTLISLPTTGRVPHLRSAFRVTHRFTRPLGDGDFGSLLEDFFGFDSSAQIGLEFRFGVLPGVQAGVHRTSERTIQFFGQGSVLQQSDSMPVGLDGLVAVEGLDNFRRDYATTIGAIVSRRLGAVGAVYVEPMFVANSNPFVGDPDGKHTGLVGLGARLRVLRTVYVVGEWAPRVGGFDPGESHKSFAIEKRAGGHIFQLNFSNAFGTTLGQVARGAATNDDWFIGFNISRKFYRGSS